MREQVKRNLSIAPKFRTNSLVRSQFMPIFSRKTFVVTKIKIRNKFDFQILILKKYNIINRSDKLKKLKFQTL